MNKPNYMTHKEQRVQFDFSVQIFQCGWIIKENPLDAACKLQIAIFCLHGWIWSFTGKVITLVWISFT